MKDVYKKKATTRKFPGPYQVNWLSHLQLNRRSSCVLGCLRHLAGTGEAQSGCSKSECQLQVRPALTQPRPKPHPEAGPMSPLKAILLSECCRLLSTSSSHLICLPGNCGQLNIYIPNKGSTRHRSRKMTSVSILVQVLIFSQIDKKGGALSACRKKQLESS